MQHLGVCDTPIGSQIFLHSSSNAKVVGSTRSKRTFGRKKKEKEEKEKNAMLKNYVSISERTSTCLRYSCSYRLGRARSMV